MTASADRSLAALKAARILVAGDIMLDRYWIGDASRISPEAPVPIVKINQANDRLGGAGNVARNIAALSGHSTLLSIVGDDIEGNALKTLSQREGINSHLIIDQSIDTTLKLRIIARNQQLLRADFETTPKQEPLDALVAQFEASLEQCQIAIFSDYGKGVLSNIESMIAAAKAKNVAVYIDPKGSDYTRYRGATLITPNLSEFEQVMGKVSSDQDLHDKALRLIDTINIESLLVTLSERGMMFFHRERNNPVHIPAKSLEVYDVSGAGDTVIAAMAMAKATGFSDIEAMEIANSAAGIVVTKLGTAVTDLQELEQALNRE